MDEAVARDWLSHLVNTEKVAFATQKQALNAQVFFYRDVCNRDEVEMQVKVGHTAKRAHLVLSKRGLMGLLESWRRSTKPQPCCNTEEGCGWGSWSSCASKMWI